MGERGLGQVVNGDHRVSSRPPTAFRDTERPLDGRVSHLSQSESEQGVVMDAGHWREAFEPPASVWSSSLRADGCRGIYLPGPALHGVPTRVFAWVGTPCGATDPAPAVVLVHGGGGSADADWVRQWTALGYVAIAVDTSGQLPIGEYGDWRRNPAGGPGGWGGFDQAREAIADQWCFHAVAAIVSAISYLTTIEGVDSNRIGLIGISWGGHLACLVSGIDPRPACVVSVYGAGFLDRSPMFRRDLAGLDPPLREQWLNRWDPRWYLSQATAPILLASGSNDTAWDVTALSDSAALPSTPGVLSIRPGLPHDHNTGKAVPEGRAFIDQHLRDGPALPQLLTPQRHGATAAARIRFGAAADSAASGWLCSTDQQGPWIDRRWRTTPAAIRDSSVSADLPDGSTAGFLALADADGSWITTPVFEL